MATFKYYTKAQFVRQLCIFKVEIDYIKYFNEISKKISNPFESETNEYVYSIKTSHPKVDVIIYSSVEKYW